MKDTHHRRQQRPSRPRGTGFRRTAGGSPRTPARFARDRGSGFPWVVWFGCAWLVLASPAFPGCKPSNPAPGKAPASTSASTASTPAAQPAPQNKGAGEDYWVSLFQGDPDSLREFQEIQAELRSASNAEAVKRLEGMLAKSAGAPWAEAVEYHLAQAYRIMNDLRRALRQLDAFLDHYPQSPQAPRVLVNKGEILYAIGRDTRAEGEVNPASKMYLDQAARVFQEVQKKSPGDRSLQAEMETYLGNTYVTMGDFIRARAAFQKVIDEYGDTSSAPSALFAQAGVCLSEGDTDGAERAYGELTDKYPQTAYADKAKKKLESIGLVGTQAPPLQIKEWIGTPTAEAREFKGKPVLLSFWAVWCPHCRRGIPRMNALAERYAAKGLEVVGVTRERPGKPSTEIQEYIASHPMRYPTGVDEGSKTSVAYLVTDIPRVVIVDAEGKIGWYGHPEQLTDQVVESFLKGSS